MVARAGSYVFPRRSTLLLLLSLSCRLLFSKHRHGPCKACYLLAVVWHWHGWCLARSLLADGTLQLSEYALLATSAGGASSCSYAVVAN